LKVAASADDPGRVINIGSVAGLRTDMLSAYAYTASKAAVHHLTRQLAFDLAKYHITVNAIAPGPFHTKMTAFAMDNPQLRREMEKQVPLGRIGQPEDIAGLTIFLSSRAGAYVTGQVIALDGGLTSRP
jgi:NAD(P)-dependent dehydrogenase (short-subunit alcohol dehydrogenase family)